MEVSTAVITLGALAQETRLKAFRLLVCSGVEGMTAGELAEELGIPPTTLSFHLKELAHAGLIDFERQGRSIRYALVVESMQEFLRFLSEDCCQGRPELCLPARKRAGRTGGKRPAG